MRAGDPHRLGRVFRDLGAPMVRAEGYDPLVMLPSLRVALDAADTGGIFEGFPGQVSQWNDISGNGHHFEQADFAKQPLLYGSGFNGGSEPYVVSDGANDTLRCASVDVNPDGANVGVFTAIMIAKAVSIVNADFEVTLGGASVRPWLQQLVGPVRWAVENRAGAVLTVPASTNPRCHFFGLNGAKTWSQIGGDTEASITHATHAFPDGGAMALFARTDTGGAPGAVQIAAFYVCAAELTVDERAAFYAYASARWGV